MTDFIAVSVWFMLSWLIRQVEGGVGEEEEEDEMDSDGVGSSPGIMEPDEPYEPIVQIIKIAIAAFSLLLLGLSLSAYSKTKLKKIIYAAVAFGLFAVQLFFDYLEDAVPSFETAYNDIIFYAMTLAILVLFFVAVVRRK
jgi:hypothetical protein